MAWTEKRGRSWRVRYQRPDGTLGSINGFTTKTAADTKARNIETDIDRNYFRDPRSQVTLAEWVDIWSEAHRASATTWAKYTAHLRNHIIPQFGGMTLDTITRIQIKRWVTQLRKRLAHGTVIDCVTLLSMLLREAVDEDLITSNPCRNLRLNDTESRDRVTATPAQVERIADRCEPADALLIRTAAYTGLRWSELAALQWHNVDLRRYTITIDAKHGALHEVHGRLELGPPKTPASVRTVHLPPCLAQALRNHTGQQHHHHVFTSDRNELLRRSNFRNRTWNPAVAGHAKRGWPAILPGLTFHALRHTHKTWMIEDGIPEVLQHERLGHRLPGIRGIYSHPSQPMIDAMLDALERRWRANIN